MVHFKTLIFCDNKKVVETNSRTFIQGFPIRRFILIYKENAFFCEKSFNFIQ